MALDDPMHSNEVVFHGPEFGSLNHRGPSAYAARYINPAKVWRFCLVMDSEWSTSFLSFGYWQKRAKSRQVARPKELRQGGLKR
jgi:hypothetical protein